MGSWARRSVVVALVTAIYVLAGALHALCDLDVTNPGGNAAIAIVWQGGEQGGEAPAAKGVVSDRHCHGCFAAAVAEPVHLTKVIELRYAVLPQPRVHIAGVMLDIETPPPKHPG